MEFHNDFSVDKIHTPVEVRFNFNTDGFDVISGHVVNRVVPDVHHLSEIAFLDYSQQG